MQSRFSLLTVDLDLVLDTGLICKRHATPVK